MWLAKEKMGQPLIIFHSHSWHFELGVIEGIQCVYNVEVRRYNA